MIKLVTDTTCAMPAAWFDRYPISTLPFNIQFGLETYREGLTITAAEFYRRNETSHTPPTTAPQDIGE